MWATIRKTDNMVLGYVINIENDLQSEKIYYVKMTPENSPAHIGGFWNGQNFSEPKE